MQTFVVRVYRSRQDSPPVTECLRGVVEETWSGFQATFHDAEELLAILRRPPRADPSVANATISTTQEGGLK